jgi:hypothetical protein
MEYDVPIEKGFTVYSKSGCNNCTKAKKLITLLACSEKLELVDCDDYLIENKEDFLTFMQTLIGKEYRVFPMIFKDGKFIGGYSDLETYFNS